MAVSVGSYVKHGLLLACILYGQINAQSTGKFNAMALAGSAAKSPETLQVPSWKYSRIANAAPKVGLSSPSAGVAEDTDGDDEAESDDVFPGAPGVSATNYNVSDLCMNHTLMYLEALADNQAWAISMLDSAGKLPSGILLGNLVWRGAYSECLNVSAVIYSNVTGKTDPSYPFRGRYCQVTAVPGGNPNATTPPAQGINALFVGGKPSITIGLCLPDSCNGEDVVGLINAGLSLLPANLSSTPIYGKCPEVQELSTDARAITVIVLASLILAVVILGTGYDVIRYQIPAYIATLPTGDDVLINQYPHLSNGMVDSDKHSEKTPLLNGGEGVPSQPEHQGKLERALLAFSIYSNGKKMLSTKQGQGTLGAVHGVRFLSMTWVMLGHTYVFGLGAGENLGSFVAVMYKRFSFQAISNATVSVDSFFLLSGLLVAYLTLKEMHKGGGRLNWGLFYFHRFWRLTPPYMLLMMVYVPLFKYLASGPVWPEDGVEINYCKDSWWTNLLYINNLVRVKEMCMGWSWYLANDMQFFVISPLILIPLYYSLVAGGAIILVLLIGSSLATGLLSVHFNAGAGLTGGGPAMDYFLYIYIRPYCRIGPYLIGLFFGYALYRTKCKARLNSIVVLVGWICAAVCCLSVLYGLYDVETHTNKVLSVEVSALYNALSRTAWSIGLGWLIFACCSGYGGFVNSILSWNALIPLSRLTYCAYLVHPIVMYVYYYSLESALNFTDLTVIYLFLGHLVMSYMAAFVISLVFESPMMGLERVFLSRDKRS